MLPSSFFTPCGPPDAPHLLHGLAWAGPGQGADTVPLLCVHGLTRNAWDFARVGAALCETRPVIALDMPGRGFSDAFEDPARYNYGTYVADCLAFMDARGLQQVDWLGTSMGGLIGMMIAATAPGRIRRLILNDVGPFIPLAALQRIAAYVGKEQDFADMQAAERYMRATYADFGIRDAVDWRRFTWGSVRRKADGRYGLNYDVRIADAFSAVTADIDLWASYDAVACPALLLRGERSDLLRAEDAFAMTRRGPKAKLVTFSGCGHAPALVDREQIGVIGGFLGM